MITVTETAGGLPAPPPVLTVPTGWRQMTARFGRHRAALCGAAFLLLLTAGSLAAGLASDPLAPRLDDAISGPSLAHPFGTDELSRDVLSRVLHGGRTTLPVAFGVALLSTAIGAAVGTVAGYVGGRTGEMLMRLVDLALIIPPLPLAIVAASLAAIGPLRTTSRPGVILLLSLLLWAPLARVLYAQVRSLCEHQFVEAARASGAGSARIITRHLLPNVGSTIIVNATLAVAGATLAESALSFLGFGVTGPGWGRMLSESISLMSLYPWMTIFPGLAIFLTVLSVSLVGNGLQGAFDPHARELWR
jgi:peptide/nickel transport system permease protein